MMFMSCAANQHRLSAPTGSQRVSTGGMADLMAGKPTVKDIMTQGSELVTCAPNDKVSRAIALMVEHRVSGLPVVDEEGMVEGVVTEADVLLVRRSTNVRTTMTRDVVAIGPDATPREAAELLTSRKVKRAIVLRPDGTLWGVISRADILKTMV